MGLPQTPGLLGDKGSEVTPRGSQLVECGTPGSAGMMGCLLTARSDWQSELEALWTGSALANVEDLLPPRLPASPLGPPVVKADC